MTYKISDELIRVIEDTIHYNEKQYGKEWIYGSGGNFSSLNKEYQKNILSIFLIDNKDHIDNAQFLSEENISESIPFLLGKALNSIDKDDFYEYTGMIFTELSEAALKYYSDTLSEIYNKEFSRIYSDLLKDELYDIDR